MCPGPRATTASAQSHAVHIRIGVCRVWGFTLMGFRVNRVQAVQGALSLPNSK